MSRDHAFWEAEIDDDFCLSCGADYYRRSKIPGICEDCRTGKDLEVEDKDSADE